MVIGVRLVIELDADSKGRPQGNLQADQGERAPFEDWLDLLRLLEGCIDRATCQLDGAASAPITDKEQLR
jgi:hypothetical protein